MTNFNTTFLRATLPGGDHVTRWLGGLFKEKDEDEKPEEKPLKQFKILSQGNPNCVHYSVFNPTTELWKCKCGYTWQEGEPEDTFELMFGDETSESRARGHEKQREIRG